MIYVSPLPPKQNPQMHLLDMIIEQINITTKQSLLHCLILFSFDIKVSMIVLAFSKIFCTSNHSKSYVLVYVFKLHQKCSYWFISYRLLSAPSLKFYPRFTFSNRKILLVSTELYICPYLHISLRLIYVLLIIISLTFWNHQITFWLLNGCRLL